MDKKPNKPYKGSECHEPEKLFLKKILFIWSRRVLGAALGILNLHWGVGIFSCDMWTLNCSIGHLVSWPGIEPVYAPYKGSTES